MEDIFAALSRESEDEVSATMDTVCGGSTDGANGAVECVSAAHIGEGAVVATFDTIFDHDIVFPCQETQIVKECLLYAVGAGGDDESRNHGMPQCLFVVSFQDV